MANERVLDLEQSTLIYRISYLLSATALYGFANRKYDLASILFCGFLTSINYWRNPTFGLRRNIDMVAIPIGLVYHAVRAYHYENWLPYYVLNGICISFYPASCYFYRRKQYWTSTYLHCMMHIMGNVSFFVLYKGAKPRWNLGGAKFPLRWGS